MELWAIKQALRMAKEKVWMGVLIESNCQDAIELVKEKEKENNHPCKTLIED